MERKFKIFLIASVCVLLGLGTLTVLRTWHGETAYINTQDVYNNFALKNKLESELKKTQQTRQYILDSLRFQVEVLSAEVQKPERKSDSALVSQFTALRENYFRHQQEFEESNAALADKYTEQIWSQLNAYIKEYGEEEGYSYIFGASGDGALMYADDAVNITDDVNGYVNERYTGK